jgi:uncharacterized protein YndB with AHSA1/START domain
MPQIKKIEQVTAESVKKGTKKDWDYWIDTLNENGAQLWSHQEIVAFLKKKHKLSSWWQQGVARGFQVYTGKRIAGQTLKGNYTTTTTKTLNSSAPKVWKFLISSEGQQIWLKPFSEIKIKKSTQFECEGGIYGEIRTMKPGASIRIAWNNEDWEKKSTLQIHLIPRPKNKCMIVFSHENLLTARIKMQMHSQWREAIVELQKHIK